MPSARRLLPRGQGRARAQSVAGHAPNAGIQAQLAGLSPEERVEALRRMAAERRKAVREAADAWPEPAQ